MSLVLCLLALLAFIPVVAAMPEMREMVASYLHLIYLLRMLCFFVDFDPKNYFSNADSPHGWQLEAIWADPTKSETARAKKGSRRHRNIPIQILAGDRTTRGGQKGKKKGAKPKRSRLWPMQFQSLDDFKLVNVYHSARALVLDFGVCFLEMHYLTHTSIQLFSKEEWQRCVQDVKADCIFRDYKVAMALQFPTHVLAFLSHDLVFYPKWVCERPVFPPDACPGYDLEQPDDNTEFLQFIINWLDRDWDKLESDDRLAIDLLRELVEEFHGVGAYSASELFFIAGLWTGLTVAEVFLNPSRLARLLEATFSYTFIAKRDFLAVILRAMRADSILVSPDNTQRKAFAKHFLHVWAKDRAMVSADMAARIEKFSRALDDPTLPAEDPYEPMYMESAFRKATHLAHLIFGCAPDDVRQYGLVVSVSGLDDPVSKFFASRGLLNAPTHLGSYSNVIVDHQEFFARTNRRYVTTYFWKASRGQVWSVNAPPEGYSVHDPEFRRVKLHDYIVDHTDRVSIGPIEYCGDAIPLNTGHRVIAPVNKTDLSTISRNGGLYHFKRRLRAEVRKSLAFACDRSGGRKVGLSDAENARLDAAVEARLAELKAAGQWEEQVAGASQEAILAEKPKRSRRSTAAMTVDESEGYTARVSGVTLGLQTVPYTGYGRTTDGHDGLRSVRFTAVRLVSSGLYGTGTDPYTAVYRISDGFKSNSSGSA
ncbi:hypothetical protein EXIGLDRAFT_771355 [Exidia glandulosa HHB12029]|uniref:Uncharacterized protein n=1 Tax=Exidia glandulosa HHB12029 TaxID=1314781 RepID=A0A165G171_EXIGL|nr:hypothetical protein EXIGLDRAFT_771355 [Exidia glandulosa HHB12029]